MFYTVGIDVGTSTIKATLMSFDDDGTNEKLVGQRISKIRKKDAKDVIRQTYDALLADFSVLSEDISYVATTGDGDMVDFRKGHFYSMTCHARGALFLNPDVRAVIDAGALHCKALVMDERSKVLSYRMTSQCASGTGQFLENISRYLGIGLEDIGPLSLESDNPEIISGICAVLAETDVINMVSRGITTANILKGIHISMARRMLNLLRMLKAEGKILVTGGLARDEGLIAAMQELADNDRKGLSIEFISHELSPFAGSIGAAIWAGFREVKLAA